MAAMSALMASLSPEQREELAALAEQVMAGHGPRVRGRPARREPAGRVPRHGVGRGQRRGDGRRRGRPCRCRRPSTRWSACTTTRSSTARCRATTPGRALDDVDEDAVRRTLGDTAAQDLRRLKQIERMLEEAGLVQRRRGRLEVTPRGARKLGERALTQVFEELQRDREGTHEARDAGGTGRADRRDAAVAIRRPRPARGAAHRLQRGHAVDPRRAGASRSPTTSRWSRRSSAPRRPPPCCSTCRSRCRCAATSSTRRRWPSRCTL